MNDYSEALTQEKSRHKPNHMSTEQSWLQWHESITPLYHLKQVRGYKEYSFQSAYCSICLAHKIYQVSGIPWRWDCLAVLDDSHTLSSLELKLFDEFTDGGNKLHLNLLDRSTDLIMSQEWIKMSKHGKNVLAQSPKKERWVWVKMSKNWNKQGHTHDIPVEGLPHKQSTYHSTMTLFDGEGQCHWPSVAQNGKVMQ